jgi:predicted TIM-barrel enzyme
VLAGVNGTDPFVLMPHFLSELKGMGFSGVQNFPTIGLFDGVMRASFEETGMGYSLEVDMIRQARELDLLTTPYVFNPAESTAMAEAGADIIVAHMGVTVGGAIGATSAKSLERCVDEIDAIAEAALAVRGDAIILCHGGPIATPEDAEFVLRHCGNCHGFYGASSMERLPVENALVERTRRFKEISFGPARETRAAKVGG